jgi:hypothetical protein
MRTMAAKKITKSTSAQGGYRKVDGGAGEIAGFLMGRFGIGHIIAEPFEMK